MKKIIKPLLAKTVIILFAIFVGSIGFQCIIAGIYSFLDIDNFWASIRLAAGILSIKCSLNIFNYCFGTEEIK